MKHIVYESEVHTFSIYLRRSVLW